MLQSSSDSHLFRSWGREIHRSCSCGIPMQILSWAGRGLTHTVLHVVPINGYAEASLPIIFHRRRKFPSVQYQVHREVLHLGTMTWHPLVQSYGSADIEVSAPAVELIISSLEHRILQNLSPPSVKTLCHDSRLVSPDELLVFVLTG